MRAKRYKFRLVVIMLLMMLGMAFLITSLRSIQIDRQDEWQTNVPTEKEETIRLPAIRGNILDRNGVMLAGSKLNYELDINLEEVSRFYNEGWDTPLLKERVGRRDGGMVSKRTETDIATIANSTIIPRLKEFGLEREISDRALRVHYVTHKGMIGFNYSDNLTFEQFCMFSENLESLPGADVSVRPRRIYPYGALAGHILGKTRLWKKGHIPEYEQDRFTHYKGDSYGDSGVEYTMNDYLRGEPGVKTIRRGPKQVYLGVKSITEPSAGADVTLSIDARLQAYVEQLLRNAGRAGATVIDVETGEILAMAAVPTMNPNDYVPKITQKKLDYYLNNKASPFLNTAIQQYQPGSVFKLPVAVAAALSNKLDFVHHCSGFETYGKRGDLKIRCWLTSGHGPLNMTSAIKRSCNPHFMALANDLGGKKVVNTFGMLGFGKKTGIHITGEESGIIPGSLNWKRHISPGEAFSPATLAQLSIGQSTSSASTLQMAAATAALANGGKYMKPRLIKTVSHPARGVLIEDAPTVKVDLVQEGVSEEELNIIKKGMWRAVNEEGGTARPVYLNNSVQIGAKTGTAQTIEFRRRSNNAWTTAFAPYDNPKYAVCVVVLGGKSGGKVAGPIVREIFRGLFTNKLPKTQVMQNYAGHIDEIEELSLTPLIGSNTKTISEE